MHDYVQLFMARLPKKINLIREYTSILKEAIGKTALLNIVTIVSANWAIIKSTFPDRKDSELDAIYEALNMGGFGVIYMDEIIEAKGTEVSIENMVEEFVDVNFPDDQKLKELYFKMAEAMVQEFKYTVDGFNEVSFQDYLNTVVTSYGVAIMSHIIAKQSEEDENNDPRIQEIVNSISKILRFKGDLVSVERDIRKGKGNLILIWMKEMGITEIETAKKEFASKYLNAEFKNLNILLSNLKDDNSDRLRFLINFYNKITIILNVFDRNKQSEIPASDISEM
jgi:hypothetical protein